LATNCRLQQIANILKRHGVEPASERKRKTTWKGFLSRHFHQIVATDFFTVEVWTKNGLQRFMVLYFIELSTRRVQLGGIARCPNGFWMGQVVRNITDCEDGLLKKNRYLIHDRDTLYTKDFLSVLDQSGIHSVKLPPRSPNLNAYAERFVRSIKEDCLERMVFFGEDSLRTAVREYVAHYHTERNHQGFGNRLIIPMRTANQTKGDCSLQPSAGRYSQLLLPRRRVVAHEPETGFSAVPLGSHWRVCVFRFR
jgi:transposase InsO family protein